MSGSPPVRMMIGLEIETMSSIVALISSSFSSP
jgi:hypothetical protein